MKSAFEYWILVFSFFSVFSMAQSAKEIVIASQIGCYTSMQLPNDNYCITGTINYNGNSDLYLALFDTALQLITERSYGGPLLDGWWDSEIDTVSANPGILITGRTKNFDITPSADKIYLVKSDFNGDTLWTRKIGGYPNQYGVSRDISVLADGNYMLGGTALSGAFLAKINGINGDTIWTRSHGSTSAGLYPTFGTAYGNKYALALDVLQFADADFMIMTFDSAGNHIWNRAYRDSLPNRPWDIKRTSDNGFIIVGESDYGINSDFLVVKTDSIGIVQWAKTYTNASNQDICKKVIQLANGSYLLSGYTVSYDSLGQPLTGYSLVIKIDTAGKILLANTYYGIQYSGGESVSITKESGILISAVSTSNSSFGGGYVVLADSLGNSCTSHPVVVTEQNWVHTTYTVTPNIQTSGIVFSHPPTVQQIPFDSIIDVCNYVSVSEQNQPDFLVNVFPNPVLDKASIEWNKIASVKISVYDLKGIKVKEIACNAHAYKDAIDFTGLPNGVYVLKLETEEGHYLVKVVKL